MRINRGTLLKLADDTTYQRTQSDRNILAVYLIGALLEEDYLLGGTADIDLVMVHVDEAPEKREIVRLSDAVHLDIAHHAEKDYRNPRRLRDHPWMGPTISYCKILYDPHHFMDFIRASVRGQFDQPDHVLSRARQQVEHARKIWFSFSTSLPVPDPGALEVYLRAVEHAANAIASLNGPPLTERRLLLNYPARAEAVGRPGLYPGLLGLLGAANARADDLRGWQNGWQETMEALPSELATARLHPHRRPYYRQAFRAILDSDQPSAVLWPLLHTWTLAARLLPTDAPQLESWKAACQDLGLSGDALPERIAALDAYLDMVEETMERWASESGA